MRVLIAFDKFKGGLSAGEACAIAGEAIRRRRPDWTVDLCPIADGGDGFCRILTAAAGGQLIAERVAGPNGRPVDAQFGIVDTVGADLAAARSVSSGRLAIIEMAAASGLALLKGGRLDPWNATTRGTGELLLAAARHEVSAILLGVGGSATHDLGGGALAALGVEFLEADAKALEPAPRNWPLLKRLRGAVPAGFPPISIACDVTNPLLGPEGAAHRYAAQKGFPEAELEPLDAASARVAALLCGHAGREFELCDFPGAGAAGGLAFGLMVAAGARIVPGFPLIGSWLGLSRRVREADLVITGEGRFDATSLSGKGAGGVVSMAAEAGKPVWILAGSVAGAAPPGAVAEPITPAGMALAEAIARAPELLAMTVDRLLDSTANGRE